MPKITLYLVSDQVYDIEVSINENGLVYGSVSLGFSTTVIETLIEEAKRYITMIAFGEVILVAMFSLVLGRYLTKQLKRLEQASVDVRSNGPGHTVPIQGNDEIASAIYAFNEMSISLQLSMNALDESRRDFKRLAQIAKENESKIKATLTACLDGIITIDEKGVITQINDSIEQIFGWTRSEMIGQTVANTIIPVDYRTKHLEGMRNLKKMVIAVY